MVSDQRHTRIPVYISDIKVPLEKEYPPTRQGNRACVPNSCSLGFLIFSSITFVIFHRSTCNPRVITALPAFEFPSKGRVSASDSHTTKYNAYLSTCTKLYQHKSTKFIKLGDPTGSKRNNITRANNKLLTPQH